MALAWLQKERSLHQRTWVQIQPSVKFIEHFLLLTVEKRRKI